MSTFSELTESAGDSINLSKIDGTPFTMIGVEDSDYTDKGKTQPGVKIITKEEWKHESGEMVNKLHTTRVKIVSKLRKIDPVTGEQTNQKIHEALANGQEFKLKVPKEKIPSKTGGQPYFDLVEA